MVVDIYALDPAEVVVLAAAAAGLFPILLYCRRVERLHLVAYGFLAVGAVATNLEHLVRYDSLNLVEHAVGNMGAGLTFAAIALLHRGKPEQEDADGREVEPSDDV